MLSLFQSQWSSALLAILLSSYSAPSLAQNKNILIFGDSLSAGYGLERGEEWPNLMQERLTTQKLPYTIINHSVSGETTSGGLSRLAASLAQAKPAIMVLELGANDGLRSLPLKTMTKNLQQMINMAQRKDTEIILVGMHLPDNYGPIYTRVFHRQFVKLADKNELSFVPFLMQGLSVGLEMYQADGLHPTAMAQPKMMENIWHALRPMLKTP